MTAYQISSRHRKPITINQVLSENEKLAGENEQLKEEKIQLQSSAIQAQDSVIWLQAELLKCKDD